MELIASLTRRIFERYSERLQREHYEDSKAVLSLE
jgi:hypothetical protein